MKADIDNPKDRESIRLNSVSGVMLGLYPPNVDLAGAAIGMLQGQLGGFYDCRRKDLAIVESPLAKGAVISNEQKLESVDVIAHELTHALQDQHFSIAKTLDNRSEDDDDSTIALRAVLEGDATLAGFGFIAGRMDDQVLDAFVKHIPEMEKQFAEKTRDVPFGIREPFIFQYMQGVRFVAEAYHRDGWPGVNALYAHPPQSTQQILNPWMYFDRPAPVPQVHIAGYEKVLKDWKKSDESAAGELILRVVIQATLGKDSLLRRTGQRMGRRQHRGPHQGQLDHGLVDDCVQQRRICTQFRRRLRRGARQDRRSSHRASRRARWVSRSGGGRRRRNPFSRVPRRRLETIGRFGFA